MTSSSYNDDEKRITGGRNGFGAKLANMFSTQFTVETVDATQEKRYIQTFHNNMSQIDQPVISHYQEEEYTMISFTPDLERFGMTELTNDAIALSSKHVHDVAGTVKDVNIFLNDKHIQVNSFEEYVQMYLKSVDADVDADAGSSKTNVVHEKFGECWEVSIVPSVQGQFQQVNDSILYITKFYLISTLLVHSLIPSLLP